MIRRPAELQVWGPWRRRRPMEGADGQADTSGQVVCCLTVWQGGEGVREAPSPPEGAIVEAGVDKVPGGAGTPKLRTEDALVAAGTVVDIAAVIGRAVDWWKDPQRVASCADTAVTSGTQQIYGLQTRVASEVPYGQPGPNGSPMPPCLTVKSLAEGLMPAAEWCGAQGAHKGLRVAGKQEPPPPRSVRGHGR